MTAPGPASTAGDRIERDQGLARGIGTAGLAFAIVNEVVGAGIFRLPGAMAAAAGTAAPLAYLGCLVAMGAVVLCFAEAGSRVPTSGGTYGYVEAAFGPGTGFVAGMMLYLSCVLSLGGVTAAFADTVAAALPAFGQAGPRALLIIAVLALVALVNLRSVALAARVIGWATFVKLIPLGLFVAAGGLWLALGHGATTAITHAPGGGMGQAVILAVFALSGMESPLAASGEVARPTRTIPRALLLAMGGVGLLYVAIQLVAERLLGTSLVGATTPLADAMRLIDPRLGTLLLAAASFSMLCWLASDMLGAPRVLFAFARDGYLPAALGRVHATWRTPHVAIVLHAVAAAALAITGTFVQLAILSALTTAALYFLGCAAAWALRRRGVATLGAPLALPALPVIAVVGMASMVVLVAIAKPVEIAALAGVIAASVALYAVARQR